MTRIHINKPDGPQQKYAESSKGKNDGWVCNLYKGCEFGCVLCKPSIRFVEKSIPLDNISSIIRNECKDIKEFRTILLCFECDPYPEDSSATREALKTFEEFSDRINIKIMTKGGSRAIRDFDILKRNNWEFGTSLSFTNNNSIKKFEYNSTTFESRREAILEAHKQKIRQWLAIEPVVDASQALSLAFMFKDIVDYFTIHYTMGSNDFVSGRKYDNFLKDLNIVLPNHNYIIR